MEKTHDSKEINYYIWLIWLGVILALFGVGLMAVNLNHTLRAEGEKAFQSNLRFIAESSAKSVKLFMEGVISEIIFQTQLEAVKKYDTSKVDASFRSVIFRHNEKISHMILLDGLGEVKVMVTNDPDPFQMSDQISQFFKSTMSGWKVNMSRHMFQSKTYRGIALGMPIFRKAKAPPDKGNLPSAIFAEGMVMALLSVNDLASNLVEPVRVEKSGFAWLYTDGGYILGNKRRLDEFTRAIYGQGAQTGRLAEEFGQVLKGSADVEGWTPTNGGHSITVGTGEEKWYLSASPVKILGHQWVMVVTAPQSEVARLLTTGFRQTGTLVLFAVAILLAGGYLLTRVNRRLARAEEKALLAAELAEKNRSLNEMNQRMDEFVSVVSHDIRSPLNVIRGFLKIIKSSPGGAMFGREISNMLRSCDRLTQLTNDILDISRFEAGGMRLAYDPIVIDNIIMESAQIMEFATKEKDLTTVIDLGEETRMEGDSGKLLQVMNNLIGNAVKFTPRGGVITIAKESGNSALTIKVSDTGEGIDDKDKGMVFSKFEQVRRRQQGVEPGSGLGLTICKNIVELHGGVIGVTSAPGKGSTFRVELPLKCPSEKINGGEPDKSQVSLI